jgi:hypothetical protein
MRSVLPLNSMRRMTCVSTICETSYSNCDMPEFSFSVRSVAPCAPSRRASDRVDAAEGHRGEDRHDEQRDQHLDEREAAAGAGAGRSVQLHGAS